jgi:RimJ/RimL family protein N-acetyltransferase
MGEDFTPMRLRIETDRLLLTPQEESDAPWLAELFTTRGTGTFTEQDALAKVAAMTETIRTTGIGALVLRVRPDLDPVGYAALVVGRASVEEPELAYELLPRAHGQGYATEAAAAVLEAAFDTGRTRIWSTVGTWNAPSLRVLEKLGFDRHHVSTERLRTGGVGEIVWLVHER